MEFWASVPTDVRAGRPYLRSTRVTVTAKDHEAQDGGMFASITDVGALFKPIANMAGSNLPRTRGL
jgi:hypothetical protein